MVDEVLALIGLKA